jgi:ribonuclease Z
MLAGFWGEGTAPISLDFVPLVEGRIVDAGQFTIDCFPVRHCDTDSFGFSFESQVRRHLLPARLWLSASRTDRYAKCWPRESR